MQPPIGSRFSTPSATDLDERSRRKPDFRAGSPVVLANGQEWFVPSLGLVEDHGPVSLFHGYCGGRFVSGLGDRVTAVLWAVSEPLDWAEITVLRLGLGRLALEVNYELSAVEVDFLLSPTAFDAVGRLGEWNGALTQVDGQCLSQVCGAMKKIRAGLSPGAGRN